jgi:hypothetical protein
VKPMLVIAAIIDICGSLKALEVNTRLPALTQPRFLESVDLMMLSSMFITSLPAFSYLIYSAAATYLLSKFA